jgi:hypothetical protein
VDGRARNGVGSSCIHPSTLYKQGVVMTAKSLNETNPNRIGWSLKSAIAKWLFGSHHPSHRPFVDKEALPATACNRILGMTIIRAFENTRASANQTRNYA